LKEINLGGMVVDCDRGCISVDAGERGSEMWNGFSGPLGGVCEHGIEYPGLISGTRLHTTFVTISVQGGPCSQN
jgi:hypothetical protein